MSLSRLRLRLTAGFALAFAASLAALSALALGYLWYETSGRLRTNLEQVAEGVAQAMDRELRETPDSTLAFAGGEVVAEWPVNDDSFVIVDEAGHLVAAADRARAADSVVAGLARAAVGSTFTVARGGEDYRVWVKPAARYGDDARHWTFGVVAYRSTEGMERDVELLGGALALAAPIIVLLSLGAGYVMARRALLPMRDLSGAIAGIAPTDLTKRLPVREPRDEIGALADAFNALLARLDEAQKRNHRFVREAAHQIRTPLTLVLGEATQALETHPRGSEQEHATLTRIRMAAEQMTHRVNELMLLAEAQAGEVIRLDADVELDGLVLECTDLMRARASSLGRTLAIGNAEPVAVLGNAALLREAVLELIENGCKYGEPGVPITVSAHREALHVIVSVESAGEAFQAPALGATSAPEGLGLPIVQWIAAGHGGELRVIRKEERNVLMLVLPERRRPPA